MIIHACAVNHVKTVDLNAVNLSDKTSLGELFLSENPGSNPMLSHQTFSTFIHSTLLQFTHLYG